MKKNGYELYQETLWFYDEIYEMRVLKKLKKYNLWKRLVTDVATQVERNVAKSFSLKRIITNQE